MKTHLSWCAAVLVVLCTVAPLAPQAAGSIFVTDLVKANDPLPIDGNQAWGGQLGDDFTPTHELLLTSIGVFDSNADGTSTTLTWRLYNVGTGALVFETQVGPSAGTGGSSVEDNYIWQSLSSPLTLTAGVTYSAVAVGFNAANPNFNTNVGAGHDVEFTTDGLNAHGGRYSNGAGVGLPTVDAGNVPSGQPYNFGAATFEFVAVPEPASILVWSLIIGAGAVAVKRFR